MRIILSIFLTFSMVTGITTMAFAEGNDTTGATTTNTQLTQEQKQAREAFLSVYFDDMNQLVTLRQQTDDAVKANTDLVKQIKDKVKEKTGMNSDVLSKVKDLINQRKALIEQAKQLRQQRISLRSQYRDAVKAKDVNQMKSIEQQLTDLNGKVSDLKAQNDTLKSQISPLRDQLKSTRDANEQLKGNVKEELQQAKTIRETIKTEQQEKAQLWNTYKENIKNKDYATAGTTFKQIIDKKAAILGNIKQISSILNQVLSSLN
ncbi:MAG: hypothetical protein Q8934_11790 [Bacillota bacterium]|nr:hypothetical protein [Bacillota bacterium]